MEDTEVRVKIMQSVIETQENSLREYERSKEALQEEIQEAEESMALTRTLAVILESDQPRRVGTMAEYDYDEAKEKTAVVEMKARSKFGERNLGRGGLAWMVGCIPGCAAYPRM